jgi:hypothetical protein
MKEKDELNVKIMLINQGVLSKAKEAPVKTVL